MKELIYLLFFGITNFLLFSYNTRKIEINYKLKAVLILVLVIILILHFFHIEKISIPNQYFFYLFIISLISFVIHYGGELSILIARKFDSKAEDNFVVTIFNFLRFYVIYFLIFFFQCTFIFSRA